MNKRILFAVILLLILSSLGFAQTSSIRDYVGVINQTYHPSIVDFFEEMKEEMKGNADAVKAVDWYLRGPSGTGFVYVDEKGDNYIITNNHVINQAHTLKFTLEKSDGSKVMYEGINVLAIDEDMDVAILTFTDRAKPFTAGLSFLTDEVNEGDAVFSAGFPGLGSTPIYQFGSGIVSNRRAMIPVEEFSDEVIGPFIQHTAPIDFGNSGGPLLVSRPGTASNYAVIGINTLKAMWRESTNYAIPAARALEFITKATGPEQGDRKAKLEERVNTFITEVRVPRAVYGDIAKYLSNACIADNAELALLELGDKGNMTVWNNIVDEFGYDPVFGMQLAVAWLIENSMRTGSGVINARLGTISPIDEDEYTVTLNIGDESISSTWVLEYGVWRIKTFGAVVVGDKAVAAEKVEERKREIAQNRDLVTDYGFMLQAGLAIMPDQENTMGFNAGLRTSWGELAIAGFDFTGNGDYTQIHTVIGLKYAIRLGSVAIMPFVEGSLGAAFAKLEDEFGETDLIPDMGFGWGLKAGLMFTTKFVKGLYLYGNYQYSSADIGFSDEEQTFSNNIIAIGIGYGF